MLLALGSSGQYSTALIPVLFHRELRDNVGDLDTTRALLSFIVSLMKFVMFLFLDLYLILRFLVIFLSLFWGLVSLSGCLEDDLDCSGLVLRRVLCRENCCAFYVSAFCRLYPECSGRSSRSGALRFRDDFTLPLMTETSWRGLLWVTFFQGNAPKACENIVHCS